jgi:hypothetical protein
MAPEETQQLLADVSGCAQDADRDGCMIIHLDGKLCSRRERRKEGRLLDAL